MTPEQTTTAVVPAPAEVPATEPAKSQESQRDWISELVVTLVVFLFGTTMIVQPFVIPTGSMEDTLLVGDHLLVDKLAYAPKGALSRWLLPFTDVKRGDIIVFKYPVNPRENYIKRVVGVPGDRLRIANKQVLINGRPLDEPYKFHKSGIEDAYRDSFPSANYMHMSDRGLDMLEKQVVDGEVVIPPDSYFAMGDNRDQSLDSRYWGFVPRENIIGKPLMIYWSYDSGSAAGGIFSKIRWNRSFQLIHGYPAKD